MLGKQFALSPAFPLFKCLHRLTSIKKLTLAHATKKILLVFSGTHLDQNKNQDRSIDKVQNLGNERRYIYKDPRQDSGQRNILYTRYPRKRFTQIYRGLYCGAMLVFT